MMRLLLIPLLMVLGCAPLTSRPAPAAPAARATVAFTGVSLVPMTRDTVIPDVTVLVEGERIVAVGATARTPIPTGAQVIDGRGRWLMPGLADAHGHLLATINARPQVRARWQDVNERLLLVGLARGVTSVVELGQKGLGPDPQHVRIDLRREIRAGQRLGPTIYLAFGKANDSTLTREQGMALVDTARAHGYDLIKVYNALSREGYRGIMLRAQQLGVPVVGHVVRSIGTEGTLGSGQRGVVHAEEFLYTFFPFRISDTTGVSAGVLDQKALPYLAKATGEAGVWVTPTLVTAEAILGQAVNLDSVLTRPEVRLIPQALYDILWAPSVNPRASQFRHPQQVSNLRTSLAFQRDLVRAFHAAGVPLLAGADAPGPGLVPGYALHDELRLLVDVGLTPYEALSAATRNVADYLGTDQFGVVKVGSRADLLLLSGDPLADVGNAGRIEGVMVRGRWLPAEELHRLTEAVRDTAPR